MNNRIWLSSPHMGSKELEFVKDAFTSNWIAPLGPNVDGFEKDLEKYNNIRCSAALSSGTAAIHLALIILGIGQGDEVICQSFTFSATVNPIIYQGAIPVFVDSEPDTWNMSPFYLRKAILNRINLGRKPKAIIPVHLYGMPANMIEIMTIANEFDIPIIEDSAEALGSKLHGKHCSTFGKLGVLSFNGNKIITTSGGGALVSDNLNYIEKAKFLSTQARDSAPHYQHSQIGYNYRISNISAGIGRGQMEVLDERISQRRSNFSFYKKKLSDYSFVSFQEEQEGYFSNRWLTCILLDPHFTICNKDKIRLTLDAENIETRPLWKPMHLQPIFSKYPYYGEKVAENLFTTGLCLPSGSNLKDEELEKVISQLILCFSN